MRYRLYIYKSTVITTNAPAIRICNRAVSLNSLRDWEGNEAAHHMTDFDTKGIAEKIYALVGEKCHITAMKPPPACGDVEYLCVVTSYACASAVLPYLHCVTTENDLILYDAETKKTFFRDLVDGAFLKAKLRADDYKRMILEKMQPIWRIRKIGVSRTERDQEYAYVVTLKKDPEKSFSRRCGDFYRYLGDQLEDGEELNTDHECFTVVGRRYRISFCLEGYKKHPDQMGYYARGRTQTKLMRRMGCEEAFFWLKQNRIQLPAVLERMNFRELKQAYPNPAERFIASVNIQKWELRGSLDIRYCGIGPYGSEILFHMVPSDFYRDEQEISVLAVEEDSAEPILSVVDKFYPYFGYRYYLEENHLPIEMWIDIVEAARKKREEYIELRNFHDAQILDVFIQWSQAQFSLYQVTGDGRMLNIQGP